MVAVPLIRGRLTAEDYEDEVAKDPLIDQLAVQNGGQRKSAVYSGLSRSRKTLDWQLQYQSFLSDGSSTEKSSVEYPIGHPRRRAEGEPLLLVKFERNLRSRIAPKNADRILNLLGDQPTAEATAVHDLFDLLVV